MFTPDENYTPAYTDFSVQGGGTVTGTTGWSIGTYVLTGTGFAGSQTLSYDPTGDINYMREDVTGTPVAAGSQTMFEGG